MSNMSNNAEFDAGNKAFGIFLLVVAVVVSGIWLRYHPNSPLRPNIKLYVMFPEVGPLEPGDPVVVGGLKKGKVRSVELADHGVWVGITMEKSLDIPINSAFQVMNTGILGKRLVDVMLGEHPELFVSGDTLEGGFDMSSTSLGYAMAELLKGVDSLVQAGVEVWDATAGDAQVQKRAQKVMRHAQKDVRTVKRIARQVSYSWDDLKKSLDTLENEVSELGQVLAAVEGVGDSLQQLGQKLQAVSEIADSLTVQINWISVQLAGDDNSAGAILHNQALHAQAQSIVAHLRKLAAQVRKKGLDMNVDIF